MSACAKEQEKQNQTAILVGSQAKGNPKMVSLERKNNNTDTTPATLNVNLLDRIFSAAKLRFRSAAALKLYTSNFYLVQQAYVDTQLLEELATAAKGQSNHEGAEGNDRFDDDDEDVIDTDDPTAAVATSRTPWWTSWSIIIIIIIIIIITLAAAAASFFLHRRLLTVKPETFTNGARFPCHMPSNPNHLIPCALFIDMNRLLELSDITGFRDWFPPRTLQDFEPFEKDEYLPLARAVADRKAIVTQVEVEFEIDRFRRHLIPRLDVADRCYMAGWHLNLECWLSPDYRYLNAFRREVDSLAHGMIKAIFGPGHMEIVNRSLSAARGLLVIIEKNRNAIDVEVQRVAEIRRDGWFSDNAPSLSTISVLEERRLLLARWLAAEVIFKCWVENQEAAIEGHLEWIKALHSTKVTHSGSLVDDTFWMPRARANILRITNSILENATISTDNSEHDRRRCTRAWISGSFNHCLFTDLKQDIGCSSHPDPTWWRWHNTVDMANSSSVWTKLLRSRSDTEDEKRRLKVQNQGWTTAVETRQGLMAVEGIVKIDPERVAEIREHAAGSHQRHRERNCHWWQWRWS